MNYEITKLEIQNGIYQSGPNKGQPWQGCQVTLKELCQSRLSRSHASEHRDMVFEKDDVAFYAAYVGKEKTLPDNERIIEHGFIVTVPMGGKYYRINQKDVVDGNGVITAKAGSPVLTSNGDILYYDTMDVLVFKEADPDPFADKPWRWAAGLSPEKKMQQLRARYYRPAESMTPPVSVATPLDDETPEATEPEHTPEELEIIAKAKALMGK